ncbi:MAG: hypothetical protein ACXWA3_05540 [Acidimicrobiales bacterium]
MRYLRWTTLAVVIAAVSVVGPVTGSPASGAEPAPYTMTADPTHGMAGDRVELTATACVDPNTDTQLVFVLPGVNGASLAAPVGRVTADADGSFVASVVVPQQLVNPSHPVAGTLVTPGDYQFVAIPFPEGQTVPCIAAFHVDRAVTLPLTVSPTSGPAGSSVEVSGSCVTIRRSDDLTVDVHAEVDGVALAGTQATDFVNKGPSDLPTLQVWAASITLPAGLADGTVVSFVGTCTGVAYVAATFVVATPTSTPVAPSVEAVAVSPTLTG